MKISTVFTHVSGSFQINHHLFTFLFIQEILVETPQAIKPSQL